MINNSNLVDLETLDKSVLIQMIQRYRQKEELQKQKLYGLASVTSPTNSVSTAVTVKPDEPSHDVSDTQSERLKRARSSTGMSDVGRPRKTSSAADRRPSPKEALPVTPSGKEKHKRGQLRGKLSSLHKKGEKGEKPEKEKEKSIYEKSEKSPPETSDKSSPRKGLRNRSLTAESERPALQQQGSLAKLVPDYDFNVNIETITSQCSLTSSKLISVKELQEDSPVTRRKILVRENSTLQFLDTVSVLAETGEEACELGMEYVQKMHNFACLLGTLKDQYPGNSSGLENVLAKISDTICDFQSYHLEFLKTLREDFVTPAREYHFGEFKAVESLSTDYRTALNTYETTKQKIAKKINTKNRLQCEEEIEPHLEILRHSSLALSNKLNEVEMFGKPQFLSLVVSLARQNFEYVDTCATQSRKYSQSLLGVRETLTSALSKVSSMVQDLPVTLPKITEEWDPKSTTIHGYMFYTTEKKGKWESAYFSIDYGYFIQMVIHNNKINKKRWNLLMSSVKPQNDANRSFVLEVTVMPVAKSGTSSSPQTILLQTDSEEMRTRWITVITNAVMELLSKSKSTGTETAKQKTRVKMPVKVQKKLQTSNKFCVDCGEEEPDWASINLGILFCRNCSGPHRAMGTSISKVRSISIDNWDIQSFKLIDAMGNTLINKILLKNYSGDLPTFTEQHEREKFIRRKYETKEWMNASKEQAPELTTKLLASVQQGDLTKSLYLILNGASVNGVDHDGYTPLHLAIMKRQYLQAQLCITNGANVNLKGGPRKLTPLHVAAANLDAIGVSQLISSGGAELEEKTADGKTASQIATEKSKGGVLTETLKLAFEGFDPSIFGEDDGVSSTFEGDTEASSTELSDSQPKTTTTTKVEAKPGDKILSMFETLQEST